jgi:hypothetical protein
MFFEEKEKFFTQPLIRQQQQHDNDDVHVNDADRKAN